MSKGKIFWGALFVALGLLFLAMTLGILPSGFWIEFWRFWPLLLVVWGASILLTGKSDSHVLYIVISLLIVALIGSGIYFSNNARSNSETLTISEDIPLNVTKANIKIDTGASELDISDSTNKLIEGTIVSFGSPSMEKNIVGDTANIELNQAKNGPIGFFLGNRDNNMNLKLNNTTAYQLKVNSGATKYNLDLSKVKITNLDLNCGASNGEVSFGSTVPLVQVSVSSGASSLKIKIPTGSGIRIENKSGLSGTNFDNAGIKSKGNNIYETDNYDNAANKVSINFSSGASSLEIIRY